jgi:hypothetical protein
MSEDRLTIVVAGRDGPVAVASFLSVVRDALGILQDVDASISGQAGVTLDWRIVDASMGSPLSLTIEAGAASEPSIAPQVILACIDGLRALDAGGGQAPRYFREGSLRGAKSLVATLNNDVERISLIAPWGDQVSPSQHVAANVDQLLPKAHEELGSFTGRLETLSKHGRPYFAIWDDLRGQRIECVIPPEKLGEAHDAFDHRVAVFGNVRYSGADRPVSIKVQQIRPLKDQSELPQAGDLEGINITDGVDPTEYVRRLRDAG